MTQSKEHLRALTGFRFPLALWVVLLHQSGRLGALPPGVSGIAQTGYVAVGFFFVLSGFVLAYNYSHLAIWQRKDVIAFWCARLARIYPAYLLGLIVVAPFVINDSGASTHEKGFSFLANATLLQSWLPRFALSWNAPGWSLSNEMFFYSIFPFLLVRIKLLGGIRDSFVAAVSIWAAALLPPMLAIALRVPDFANALANVEVHDGLWANFFKFFPLLRLPEFCMGILLAHVHSYLRAAYPFVFGRGHYMYLPAFAMVATTLAAAQRLPYPLVHNGLLLPLYASIILGLSLGGGFLVKLLSAEPLQFFGGASYSLYILHVPFASWTFGLASRILGREISGPVPIAIYMVSAVLLSGLVLRCVEEPLGRHFRRWLSRILEKLPISNTPGIRIEQPAAVD